AMEPPEALWREAFGEKAVAALSKKGLLAPILKKRITDSGMAQAEAIVKKHAPDAVDAVIALPNYSTTHTTFRKLLTKQGGARYASMPLFDEGMLEGPLHVDYREMKRLSAGIAKAVKTAVSIEIKTPNGTDIVMRRGRRAVMEDTGDLRRPGSTSNLPAGEVYLAPVEGSANGTLVLEWGPTRKLKSPVTLVVEEGSVVRIGGREPFVKELARRLSVAPECANIAELGIGTNALAKRPDNILESEKILGTVHIALGDNHTFGGKVKAPFHQDFVFFNPTLTLVDGKGGRKTIIKKGRLETKEVRK
ncbi:MAG: aminopeptidase, partial [Nitrospiraceae bacterium]|nr:aminopeptidase [Nitrospiraceae bacterium]